MGLPKAKSHFALKSLLPLYMRKAEVHFGAPKGASLYFKETCRGGCAPPQSTRYVKKIPWVPPVLRCHQDTQNWATLLKRANYLLCGGGEERGGEEGMMMAHTRSHPLFKKALCLSPLLRHTPPK